MSHTPRVLIADDEPALLDLYDTWLDGTDATVVRATCGAEALSHCDEFDIDVAILDRHMPRVSGDEVLDTLQERPTSPRVAFVTAATPDVRIVNLDIDAYLTKPVGREEFVDLVRSLIRREQLPTAAERYVSKLSKRAALLNAESPAALQTDPLYVALEEELSGLAKHIDARHLDDPYLRRALPDGGTTTMRLDPPA
ncbi:MAG: response regulator transcription factor [Haloplanus sp.]